MITAFFLTSGWLMAKSSKERSIKEHVEKRFTTLIQPYLWFSLLFISFTIILVLFGLKEPKAILVDLYKTITLRGIGTLWFLPALLGGEIIFLYLMDKGRKYLLIALGLTIFYNLAYWGWSVSWGHSGEFFRILDAPFRTLSNVLKAWPIIAIAYYLGRSFGFRIERLANIRLILLIIILAPFSYFLVNQLPGLLSPYLYAAFIGPLLVHVVCPFVILLFAILTEKLYVNTFFIFWGKNSLILMAIHYSILLELSIIANYYMTGATNLAGINGIFFFIAAIILQYPIVFFINSKAKFLIGK